MGHVRSNRGVPVAAFPGGGRVCSRLPLTDAQTSWIKGEQQQKNPEEAENNCKKCSTFADLRGDPADAYGRLLKAVGATLPLIKIHGSDLQL